MSKVTKAQFLRDGDIFLFNGKEMVITDDYNSFNNEYCFCTNRKHWNKEDIYSYTSGGWEQIPKNANVEIVGNMVDIFHGNELKKLAENKDVIKIAIYDEGSGIAEVLNYDEGNDEVALQWVTFCPCYDSQVYSKDIYNEQSVYGVECVAELKPASISRDEIAQRREKSIEYDKPIFERHQKLEARHKNENIER